MENGKEVDPDAVGQMAMKWLAKKGWVEEKEINKRKVYFLTAKGLVTLKALGLDLKEAYKK